MRIWTVDAFTSKPFSGNPAAVCLLNDFPEDARCKSIAAEMNLSETAFVKPINEEHFHIRWFTPKTEVKLCGHATLATAHILWEEDIAQCSEIFLNSLTGQLTVTKLEKGYTLNFPAQPSILLRQAPVGLLEGLGLTIPPQSIYKAFDDVLIELKIEQEVRDIVPDIAQLVKVDCRGIIVTAPGENKYDFVSRFFAPRVGVNEDPVTGSAHCKLVPFWSHKLKKTQFKAFQASSRGGELVLELKGDRVLLTGQAVTMLVGELKC